MLGAIRTSDMLNHYPSTCCSALECSHFLTGPSFSSYLAAMNISRWHLKQFKSYHTDKLPNTPTNGLHSKQPILLCYRCMGDKQQSCANTIKLPDFRSITEHIQLHFWTILRHFKL